MTLIERVRDASTVLQTVIGVLLLAVLLGAGYGLYRGLQGNDQPPPEETVRASVIDRYAQQLGRMAERRDSALQVARSADSAAAVAESALSAYRDTARENRRELRREAARAGENLLSTLDSIRSVTENPAVVSLADTAEGQLTRYRDTQRGRITSLRGELEHTERARLRERAAKVKWRNLYHQTDSALAVAEARADSLSVSREYWQDEARTSFGERLASGYGQAAGKIAAVGIACYPETGTTEACIGAAGMWAVDAALEGLP